MNGTDRARQNFCRFLVACFIATNVQACNLGTFPTTPEEWDQQAGLKYQRGEYHSATNDWDRAIMLAPENPDYFWKRSRATMRFDREPQQSVDDALKAIQLLKDKDPRKLIYFYVQLGEAYAKKGEFPQSKEAFDKAVELSKGTLDAAPVFMERGRILLLVGDSEGAIADLTKAISIVPTLGRAYHLRGKAYEVNKDPIAAAKDFEKANSMNYDAVDDRWEPLPID